VHVDTVFPAAEELSFSVRDGRLTGPGIGDNAAAVVTVCDVVSTLGAGTPLAVAFTVGEEGLGNLRGAHAACEQLRPASAVAVEGHGLEHVLVDAVGSIRLRLAVAGPGGHSWQDRGTPSAVHELLRLGAGLTGAGSPATPVNIGTVAGGRSVNTIAASAELVVEMRALDDAPLERFGAEVRALSAEPPLSLVVEEAGRRPAGRLDRSSPLLAAVRSVREELGLPDTLAAGSTDANAALAHGIPALTIGVSRGGRMHSRDEWIEAASLEVGREQLRALLAALTGRS
jgi:tripeptide aminopeptidase